MVEILEIFFFFLNTKNLQDMARLLKHARAADTKLTCGGTNSTEISVHSSVITARSSVLANMISPMENDNFNEDSQKKNENECEEQMKTIDEEEVKNVDVCVHAVEENHI